MKKFFAVSILSIFSFGLFAAGDDNWFMAQTKKAPISSITATSELIEAQYEGKYIYPPVNIVDGNLDGVLPCEIFSELGSGTMIYTSNYGKIRAMTQTDIPSVLGIMRPFVEKGNLLERTEAQLAGQLADFVVYEIDVVMPIWYSLHKMHTFFIKYSMT